jgi:hypothetical protein
VITGPWKMLRIISLCHNHSIINHKEFCRYPFYHVVGSFLPKPIEPTTPRGRGEIEIVIVTINGSSGLFRRLQPPRPESTGMPNARLIARWLLFLCKIHLDLDIHSPFARCIKQKCILVAQMSLKRSCALGRSVMGDVMHLMWSNVLGFKALKAAHETIVV